MLVSFRVENFRSFAEEQELSLVAGGRDTMHADSLIDCEKYKLHRSAGIFGANASGKSNVVKAFSVFRNLVLDSATSMNLGEPIPGMDAFRLDADWRSAPTSFEISANVNETYYEYGFSATPERVHDEWFSICKPKGKLTERFKREFDPQMNETRWEFKGFKDNDATLLRNRTRDNGLLLSRAAELNFEQVQAWFGWLRSGMRVVDFSSIRSRHLMVDTAHRVKDDPNFKARVLEILRDADLGISGLQIEDEPFVIPESIPSELRDAMTTFQKLAGPGNFRSLSVTTLHEDSAGKMVPFSFENEESLGTQRFFTLLSPILQALDNGSVLVVDELDCSMHSLLSRKIVEMFQDPNSNPHGAQLIFTTHDTSLMVQSLLRRDQIWLAEKNRAGATELFSLFDIPESNKPRNSEALEKNYRDGRYGGIPVFGPELEDLDVS